MQQRLCALPSDEETWHFESHLKDVEANRLSQWSALAGSHDVTLLRLECWGAVDWKVAVALLEPIELLDVVEVVAADHDGALHLRRDDHALQDSSADADVPQFARARDPSGAMHMWSQDMQD